MAPARPAIGGAGRLARLGGAVGGFFALKIAIGLLLVTASARQLSVREFVTFSQLFLFLALLSTVSAGGVQGGVTRQVAVADGDGEAERRAVAAGLGIWAVCGSLLVGAAALLGAPLSVLLIGSPDAAGPILLIAAAALLGGGGAVLCSALTGQGRAPLSLGLQGAGLLVGGGGCLWRLAAGDAAGAVLAYAAGPIVTAILALGATRALLPRPGRPAADRVAEARLLLRFSGAAMLMAVLMPATLFALRHLYRLEFGTEPLGYWLTANRVSDVTSQLLGLYMGQLFLPQMTRTPGRRAARRLMLGTLALGTAVMAAGWLVFLVDARFFVRTFFAERFLPAIPFIGGYLLGDALRVAGSMAMNAALARGRLRLAIGVEALTALLIAAFMLSMIAAGRTDAPWLAYVLAQGTMTLVVLAVGLRVLERPTDRAAPTPGMPDPTVQGSAAG